MSDKLIDILKDTDEGHPVERALIYISGHMKIMVAYDGISIGNDVEYVGMYEAGPIASRSVPEIDGLWLWEGKINWIGGGYDGYNGDYNDAEPSYDSGTSRRLTPEEAVKFAVGDLSFMRGKQ